MSPEAPRRYSAVQVRRRRLVAVLVVLALVAVVLWALTRGGGDPPSSGPGAASAGATPEPSPTGTARRTPTASRPSTPSPTTVRQRGTGRLVVVPGAVPAPGRGTVVRVRVEVEQGVDVDVRAFAATVLATLNDRRSWGHGGTRTFARTTGDADVVVVLASPDTSAELCRPLVTHGKLSCGNGDRAVLTSYRWARGTPEFPDLDVYRQYVVNHEVGHVLGHHHEQCGGAGRLAPVMQQQTKQVAPCRPNAWPYP
ncbi:DUF3152 domain-containing protein [Angustibacter peucedani]